MQYRIQRGKSLGVYEQRIGSFGYYQVGHKYLQYQSHANENIANQELKRRQEAILPG